jgi:uncharacterized protein YbjT (DUF2867 family)
VNASSDAVKPLHILLRTGSGAVPHGLLPALFERGHTATLAGPGAAKLAARWPDAVTALADAKAADANDAAVNAADVVVVVREGVSLSSERATPASPAPIELAAGQRLVVIAPLGAPDPGSDLELARRSGVPWMVIRTATVFGAGAPAEDLVSNLVALVRNLSVVPTLSASRQPFAPVYAMDLGRLVVAAIDSEDAWSRLHEVRGSEVVTLDDLVTRLAAITGKKLLRVPLPSFLGGAGAAFARLFGVTLPRLDDAALGLFAHALAETPSPNAFATLGVTTTTLDEALKELAASMPPQLPSAEDGFGALQHKRFWVDIEASRHTPEALLDVFRRECAEIMPIEFDIEPGVEASVVNRGQTLTAALPGRGHIQMRVEESEPRKITFVTLEGHPIAGVVRFLSGGRGSAVRFMVEVFARSASPFDFVAFKLGAQKVQELTWKTVCERMLERSGGTSKDGVQHHVEELDEPHAERAEAWIEEIVTRHERELNERESAERAAQ